METLLCASKIIGQWKLQYFINLNECLHFALYKCKGSFSFYRKIKEDSINGDPNQKHVNINNHIYLIFAFINCNYHASYFMIV